MPSFSKFLAWCTADNARDLLFVVGFALFGWGIAAYSVPLAGVVCGGVLMGLACVPYVWRVR